MRERRRDAGLSWRVAGGGGAIVNTSSGRASWRFEGKAFVVGHAMKTRPPKGRGFHLTMAIR
jgi:hypothetical protein